MIKVAKVLIQDADDRYLVLFRNNHPVFGNEADLPGGTIEKGESPEVAAIREVIEEAGITLRAKELVHSITTRKYSKYLNQYTLYFASVKGAPRVMLSWEHGTYEWVTKERLLALCSNSIDSYLHMVGDQVREMV